MDNRVVITRKLQVGYSRNILFQDLELVLERGKMVCFMGPNGIGKSSLIRTIAGLQKPLSGEVDLLTENEIHKHLAVVLTDRVVGSNITTRELIAMGRLPYLDWAAKINKDDNAIIAEAVAKLHLAPILDKDINELSDGQLQMAMIARALAQDTPVIIMDEPTAHLDLNNRLEIMNILLRLARTMNKAVLVATHELDLALQTADEIWLAGGNKSVLTGIPEDLVLRGAFDDIFQFKGFDLRTGKVQHEVRHNISVKVIGHGHELLWTKNALERNGFAVTEEETSHQVFITETPGSMRWLVDNKLAFTSIKDLLNHLQQSVISK